MRERFTGTTALVVLGLIAIPFVFVGISSPLIGSGYAAKVDGDEISLQLFEQAWQNQITQNPDYLSYPPQIQNMLRDQILDRLIRDRLMIGYMSEVGMRVSDKMVTDLVQQIPQYQADGVFSMEAYESVLALEGRTPTQFEASVAKSLLQFQLQQAVLGTAFVTPSEYRRYLNLFAEQRRVTVATIGFEAIKESIEVSDDEILAFYDENSEQFYTQETVDLQYIEIRRDELAANAEIDADELQLYYEGASNRYMQDEQRQARHILILFGEDDTAARDEAKSVLARVQAGEPFADLARQYSKDTMTAERGGDLGLILQSQMDDALGDTIFSMKKGEIKGPIRSDFGFHIVQLDDIVGGGPLPLEQVRAELETELRDARAEADFRALENAVSNAMFDSLDIEAMGETVGLEVQTSDAFTRAGGAPFGANQAVIDAAFDERLLSSGDVSDIVEIDANRSVVIKVAAHHEALLRPLGEVRESIAGALKSAGAQELITARSEELQAMLRRGDDIDEAATSMGAVVSATATVGRSDSMLDARLLAAIFRTKRPLDGVPRVGGSFTQGEDYAVFRLEAVAAGRPESIPLADRDARKQELAAQSGSADFTAFVSELQQRAVIVKSDDIKQPEDTF